MKYKINQGDAEMNTITVSELRNLRKQYAPTTEQDIARIQSLDWPDERKAKRISAIKSAAEKNANMIKKFDAAISKDTLPPDSHGGFFDKEAIWNGSLLLVKCSPNDYRIEVHQYGAGTVYIQL